MDINEFYAQRAFSRPKRQYVSKFSKNPLPLILGVLVILFLGLNLIGGLKQSEIEHCEKTSTIKSICK